eukprot:7013139-Lingulodinium_polyedra.AAC.1
MSGALPRCPDDEVARADEEDRLFLRQVRGAGISYLAGPPAIPPPPPGNGAGTRRARPSAGSEGRAP